MTLGKSLSLACLFSLCALFSSCTNETPYDDKLRLRTIAHEFVPNDAVDVIEATELSWVQLSFDIARAPDEFALSPAHVNRARQNGWVVCAPRSSEWTVYEDRSVVPPRNRRQKLYLFHREDILVLFVSTMSAKDSKGSKQHAIVVARRASNRDIEETAKSYHLACSDT